MSRMVSSFSMAPELQRALGMEGLSLKSITIKLEAGEPVMALIEVLVQDDGTAGVIEVVKQATWKDASDERQRIGANDCSNQVGG